MQLGVSHTSRVPSSNIGEVFPNFMMAPWAGLCPGSSLRYAGTIPLPYVAIPHDIPRPFRNSRGIITRLDHHV